ncbi:hypothetical protein [Campylobacter troglodytis]|uniref:hypothetical protein n=1 Tax=Campylobacter troglodytis TaxID=654363 RepID=UPI001157EF34|nr:hypothetical protein [Campylobacter troglodytis]TQR53840.1 hypothetical protein DMC01_10810 [Campylobacter troglodytis]
MNFRKSPLPCGGFAFDSHSFADGLPLISPPLRRGFCFARLTTRWVEWVVIARLRFASLWQSIKFTRLTHLFVINQF